MKCLIYGFAAIICFGNLLFSQQETSGLLSWQRFSINFSSTYYANPWDNYNQAMKTVTNEIRLNNFFFEPRGEYETINGDVLFKGGIGYNITNRIKVSFTGQFGETSAAFETFPDAALAEEADNVSPAHRQEFTFDLKSFGIDAAYRFPLSEKLFVLAGGGIDRYSGSLDFNFTHDRNSQSAISDEDFPAVQATFKENVLGWNFALGTSFKLAGPVSIEILGSYRNVKFSNLQGDGSQHFGDTKIEFNAELVEAPNFFGIESLGLKEGFEDYRFIFGLPDLTFLTSPPRDERTPAVIDMTALGIRAGIDIRL